MRSAIAGLAGLAVCSACFAQDVLVTAPRFPEEIRRLPASITVITQEDIERSAARTLPELIAGKADVERKRLGTLEQPVEVAVEKGDPAFVDAQTLPHAVAEHEP